MTRLELIEQFRQLKAAYQVAFTGTHGSAVMADLKVFCRAEASCFHEDPRVHAAREGAREVFLRIQDFLAMTPEQMVDTAIKHGAIKVVPNMETTKNE